MTWTKKIVLGITFGSILHFLIPFCFGQEKVSFIGEVDNSNLSAFDQFDVDIGDLVSGSFILAGQHLLGINDDTFSIIKADPPSPNTLNIKVLDYEFKNHPLDPAVITIGNDVLDNNFGLSDMVFVVGKHVEDAPKNSLITQIGVGFVSSDLDLLLFDTPPVFEGNFIDVEDFDLFRRFIIEGVANDGERFNISGTITSVSSGEREIGPFGQSDLVDWLIGGKYLTGLPATMKEGDLNNDNLFNTKDIVFLLSSGLFISGNQNATSPISIPEPPTSILILSALFLIKRLKKI